MHRPFDHILKRRHVREQIEALEHHAGSPALLRNLALREFVQLAVDFPVSLQDAAQANPARGDHLELVDAA